MRYTARISTQVHWLMLVWLAVGAMGVQLVATPRIAALDRLADSQEVEEEESEPAESSGEEELPQISGNSIHRLRRPEMAALARIVSVGAPIKSATTAHSVVSAELASRNGIGGPLRC